jgi:hypothetical protein
MKRTPLARKAPIRKAKPGVAAAQYAQRRALAARSGGRCEMEHWAGAWVPCFRRASDAAHIYTRPKNGAARDLVDAVIHACRACHSASEGKLGSLTVRVPLRRAQAAWRLILAHSTLGVDADDRLRIHIGSLGDYPEKGQGIYA